MIEEGCVVHSCMTFLEENFLENVFRSRSYNTRFGKLLIKLFFTASNLYFLNAITSMIICHRMFERTLVFPEISYNTCNDHA